MLAPRSAERLGDKNKKSAERMEIFPPLNTPCSAQVGRVLGIVTQRLIELECTAEPLYILLAAGEVGAGLRSAPDAHKIVRFRESMIRFLPVEELPTPLPSSAKHGAVWVERAEFMPKSH